MTNPMMTESEERKEIVKAVQAIKFSQVELNTLAYWHYLSIIQEKG